MKMIDADDFGKWLQKRIGLWGRAKNGTRHNECSIIWTEFENRVAALDKSETPGIESDKKPPLKDCGFDDCRYEDNADNCGRCLDGDLYEPKWYKPVPRDQKRR